MKARDYLEHQYYPWVFSYDAKDLIGHFKNNKEEFLCESYNYVSKQFKEIEHYELYDFRITSQKIALGGLSYEMICAKTPAPTGSNNAIYIILINNDEEKYYYTVDSMLEGRFEIKKFKGREFEVIGITDDNITNITSIIKKNLFMS